jgi:uncharacterized phage protein (TIGR02218 family)
MFPRLRGVHAFWPLPILRRGWPIKPASSAFKNLLFQDYSYWVGNLFTITLFDGTIFTWTDFEYDVVLSGTRFSSRGPYPLWSGFTQKIGVEVDEGKLQLWALLTNLVESQAVLQAIGTGLFDNADIVIQRVMMGSTGAQPARPINFDTSAGAVTLFHGNVSDITEVDRSHAEIDIKSKKELLNRPFPAHVYQPACRWDLYGAGCTLNINNFYINGSIVGSGSLNLLFNTTMTNIDHYFDEGLITFTSGANVGVTRTVRLYLNASGQTLLFVPLPAAPANGDQFKMAPGCDKQLATCRDKFNNLINLGSMPFVPVAESAI